MSEKIEQLTEWSLKKPVIKLNFDKFKHFVKSAPRNYSIVVMLTALNPQRDCQICRYMKTNQYNLDILVILNYLKK